MTVYQKAIVRVGDAFCDEPIPPDLLVDIVRFNHWTTPPGCGYEVSPRCTRLVDLTRSEEQLLADMNPRTRRQIRRAQREAFRCDFQFPASIQTVLEFCNFYEAFALSRGLDLIDQARIESLATAERLEINRAIEPDGAVLVWHVAVRMPRRILLLYSCSAFRDEPDAARRNRIARANRYLHWLEFQRWKRQGVETLDLGGWYEGNGNQQLLQINRFKETLGGRAAPIHNALVASTFRGHLALRYLRFKHWRQKWMGAIANGTPIQASAIPNPPMVNVENPRLENVKDHQCGVGSEERTS